MGEKTINQFKGAFLTEIDNLLPALIKNYIGELKNQVKLDDIIFEKISAVSIFQWKEIFYKNTIKQRRYFSLAAIFIGLLTGSITVLILFLLSI